MAGRSFVGVGVAIGVAVGAGVGVALGNLALGLGLGIAVGVALGFIMDANDKRRGRDDDGAGPVFGDGGGAKDDTSDGSDGGD